KKAITFTNADIQRGVTLIGIGLVKKILIADLLALLAVDAVFDNPTAYSSVDLLFALYGYTFQIYCDFSGYSDIAIGTALLFGLHLPLNFNSPYLARNPSDFWQRWHISLSSWLRDYLYISLGGNRGSTIFTMRNLMITMLLGGLWHGAAMHFVVWGAYHGALLIAYRALENVHTGIRVPVLAQRILFFHLVVFGWLIFRVDNMQIFSDYLAGLGELTVGSVLSAPFFAILAVAFVSHFLPSGIMDRAIQWTHTAPVFVRSAVYAGMLLTFFAFSVGSSAFIYFQF